MATASRIRTLGRVVALTGVVLPLLLIGGMKFTQLEIQALKPMIGATPWLAWLPSLLGDAGASYFLGTFEIITAVLLLLSRWSPKAGVAGGALASLIFLTTCSMMIVLPVWEPSLGGFPALGGMGQFLIKDVTLLGVSLVVLGESLARDQGVRVTVSSSG